MFPPKWADRFLSWYCSDRFLEEIQGDLHERFQKTYEKQGRRAARRQFVIQVFRFMRPFRIKRLEEWNIPQINPAMISHYFKITLRSMRRRWSFSLLNVLGLAIGMAACMLILHYVSFEWSYDDFYSSADRLYRVSYSSYEEGAWSESTIFSGFGMGPILLDNMPEVEKMTRVHPWYTSGVLKYTDENGGEKTYYEQQGYFADPAFLEMFDFPLIEGNRSGLLSERQTIVVTKSMALKYFGNVSEAIDKVIEVNGNGVSSGFRVVGVLEDIPAHTHFDFEFLLPLEDVLARGQYKEDSGWNWDNFFTYIQLHGKADTASFTAMAETAIKPFLPEQQFGADGRVLPVLFPVNRIHLYSQSSEELTSTGNADNVSFFILIAVLILIIAWINYINLSTSRAIERALEIGIRKTIGAKRGQIMRQFLFESVFMNLIALAMAVIFTAALLPVLSDLIRKELDISYQQNLWLWGLFGGSIILGAFLAGLYPAMILSSFRPVAVLKSRIVKMSSGITLRKMLVVFQFAASVGLIAGTFAVYKQISFMKKQDLGMQLEQILVVNGPRLFEENVNRPERLTSFKNEVLKIPQVSKIAGAGAIPGGGYDLGTSIRRMGQAQSENELMSAVWVDSDFTDTYGMEVIAGKGFSNDRKREGVLINEATVRLCELGDPEQAVLNKLVTSGNDTVEIAGVLKDYAWNSMRQAHAPFILIKNPNAHRKLCIKMSTSDLEGTISQIGQVYQDIFPANPFDYHFQDEFFNRQYAEDQQFGSVFGLFTALAMVVACLGLLGLASYSASLRVREIGIRKVIGASLEQLVLLLSGGFMKLVGIAVIIGLVLAWWLTNNWLEEFPYRISLGWWFFVGPAVLVSVIALLTISYRTVRTAMINPAEVLKGD